MRCIFTHGNCYHYEDVVEKRSAGAGYGARHFLYSLSVPRNRTVTLDEIKLLYF